jgi:hypothetical protein
MLMPAIQTPLVLQHELVKRFIDGFSTPIAIGVFTHINIIMRNFQP